jgi:hypothetical protein
MDYVAHGSSSGSVLPTVLDDTTHQCTAVLIWMQPVKQLCWCHGE